MKKLKQKAFTLVELMVVIAIIILALLGSTSLNFGKLSKKQRAEMFSNKIVAEIERVRNNALIGKGIKDGSTILIPKTWKLEVHSGTNSALVVHSYTGTVAEIDTTTIPLSTETLRLEKFETIADFSCINSNGTGIIFMEGRNYTMSGACAKTATGITIEASVQGESYNINFDRINGLVETERKK